MISLSVEAETTLDDQFFPSLRGKEDTRLIVVQGNWKNDKKSQTDNTGWMPVRLFGVTDAPAKLTLSFTTTASVAVTLRTRAAAAKKLTDGVNPNKPLIFDVAVPGTGLRKWWWEGFLFVGEENLQAKDPVTVNLVVDDGVPQAPGAPKPKPLEVDMLLGECWLFAGGPGVGARFANLIKEEELSGQIAPRTLAFLGDENSVPASGKEALGEMFARYLNTSFVSSPFGSRPVCVYTWSKGRRFIGDWVKSDGLGDAWNGFLSGDAKEAIIPGVRGVVWWHGEWEAEYGGFTGRPTKFHLDRNAIDAFRASYAADGKRLREKVLDRLAWAGNPEPEIAKRILWVVAQSPGAGRQPEFFDAFRADPANQEPETSWAPLRAAQFDIVDQQRKKSWMGRPTVMLVPLQGAGSAAPGWAWNPEDAVGRQRFDEAGKRIAFEVFRSLTLDGREQPDYLLFPDGWPRVDWTVSPPKLMMTGVAKIGASPVSPSAPGVAPPLIEAYVGGTWDAAKKSYVGGAWHEVKFQESGPYLLRPSIPPAANEPTNEVRYSWADATRGLHQRVFKENEPASPLPAFHLKRPQP